METGRLNGVGLVAFHCFSTECAQLTQQTRLKVFSVTGGRFWKWSFPPPSPLRSPLVEVIHYVCLHFIQMGVQVCQ